MSLLLLFGGAVIGNTAPVVDAGPATILGTTSVAYSLTGSVTDDGLPSGTLTSLWTKESGPGIITFVDDTDPTTDVTADTAGTYVLRLTGDDGALTAFDETTFIVADPPAAGGGSIFDQFWNFLWR